MATQALVNDGKLPFLTSSCQKDCIFERKMTLEKELSPSISTLRSELEKSLYKKEVYEPIKPEKTDLSTHISQSTELDEETESSSCFEESDSDFSDSEVSLRLIETKWELDKYDLAWRWRWLKLQVSELEQQVNHLDQLYEERRALKPKFLPLNSLENGEHCARTAGISKPRKYRKVHKKAPTTLSARNSILEGFQHHPLFSFPEKKKKPLKEEKSSKKSVQIPKPEKKDAVNSAEEPSSASSEGIEPVKTPTSNHNSSKKRKRPNLTIDIPNKEESKKSPRLSTQNTSATPKSNHKNQKRTYLRTRDFNIDNIVIPYNAIGTNIKIQPKCHKEISTPTWRDVESVSQEFLICSSEQAKDEENLKLEKPQAMNANNNLEESEEEDTSDEFYASMHLEKEIQEMKHRLVLELPQKKYSSLENDFSLEKFLSPNNDIKFTPELQKIKDILIEAKESYLNSPKFQKDWNQGDYGNEYYFLVEEEAALFEDLSGVCPYEVIKKDPPLDPHTKKERHIIYLKKITTTN